MPIPGKMFQTTYILVINKINSNSKILSINLTTKTPQNVHGEPSPDTSREMVSYATD